MLDRSKIVDWMKQNAVDYDTEYTGLNCTQLAEAAAIEFNVSDDEAGNLPEELYEWALEVDKWYYAQPSQ